MVMKAHSSVTSVIIIGAGDVVDVALKVGFRVSAVTDSKQLPVGLLSWGEDYTGSFKLSCQLSFGSPCIRVTDSRP